MMLCLSPPSTSLRIAVAQPMVIPGDVAGNLVAMTPHVERAARMGARLVLFSECGLTGYDLRGRGIAAAVRAEDIALSEVSNLAAQHGIVVVQGFYERDGDTVCNSAVAFFPDGSRVLQRKHRIIGHEAENTPVRPSSRGRQVFEVGGLRFAILICADNGIEGIHAELAAQEVDVILAPTAGCGDVSWAVPADHLSSLQAITQYADRARSVCFIDPSDMIRHRLAMACCNQAGYIRETGFFHPGHAAVIDHTGETTALIPGQPAPQLLRPQLAVGFVTPREQAR